MPVQTGPCGWEPVPCGPLPPSDLEEYEPLRQAAADVLWALSGRRFGTCEVKVRPCRPGCAGGYFWPSAALVNGHWINVSCGRCDEVCSCPTVDSIRLPSPFYQLVELKVDGVSATGAARVYDGGLLVRTDGGEWPTCQDMSKPDTEVGTWSVTYLPNEPLPPAGQRALGEMMSEMWKACGTDGSCRLPKRVQSIVRQGVTYAFLDPMDFLEKGKTGLYFCDLWLSAVNPQARPSGARILSPDMPRHYRETWP